MNRKKGFINLVIYFWGTALLGMIVPVLCGFSNEFMESFLFFTIIMSLSGLIIVAYNFKFIKQQFKDNFRKKETYVYGVLGAVVLVAIAVANTMMFQAIDPAIKLTSGNESELNTMLENTPKIMIILVTGFIIPFIEEIVFRAGIMGIITQHKVKDSYVPYILCALAFTFLHDTTIFNNPFDLQNIYFFTTYLIPSLVLSIFYKKTNHNLLAVYVIHIINNVIGSL